jgi:two-component system, cell cycle response regulator
MSNSMLPLILIVDDSDDLLDFLERMLSERYDVKRANDGEQALQILREQAIHLVISDIMMPVMDGYEFCKIIKTDVELSHVPVILLTAKNTIQSKVQGLELGADAYIEKPFSKEHLLAQISSLLVNRNTLRQYFASSPLVHIKSIAHTRSDEKFLESLESSILAQIDDSSLDVERLATCLNMSRVTLYRKIKAVSDMSPAEFIHITRLKKAAELLASGEYRMYEIADVTGFSSQSNFAKMFHKQFNMTPTEYMLSKVGAQ